MTAEIDQATSWVHVEFYITAWDDVTGPFFDALVRATERGVTRPAAVRPPRLARHPGLQGLAGAAGRDRDRVASDAADPAAEG